MTIATPVFAYQPAQQPHALCAGTRDFRLCQNLWLVVSVLLSCRSLLIRGVVLKNWPRLACLVREKVRAMGWIRISSFSGFSYGCLSRVPSLTARTVV